MTRLVGCTFVRFFWFVPCLGPLVILFAPAADGQSPDSAQSPIIACSPESPTVQSGESIEVRAWLNTASPPLRYAWTATGGAIVGHDEKARWNFNRVEPGLYEAQLVINGPATQSIQCSVKVVVREDVRKPPNRETGRSLLNKGSTERPGYGLYSYLLLGSPPTDASRERYLVAVDSYLRLIQSIEKLETYSERKELNITYLPVDIQPPTTIAADWVLEHYDYARARFLLGKLPGNHQDGPYIVSSLTPLSQPGPLVGHYLYQDLSLAPAVPKDLISWWIREFLNQSAQESFWEEKTGERLALNVRTTIAILAIGVPQVRKALDTAVAWLH